jgi:hypothetical protein
MKAKSLPIRWAAHEAGSHSTHGMHAQWGKGVEDGEGVDGGIGRVIG